MKLRTIITKSRAGHYTVSLRDERGALRFIQDKIDNLHNARAIANRETRRIAISSAIQAADKPAN